MKDEANTHLVKVWFDNTYYSDALSLTQEYTNVTTLAKKMREFVVSLFPNVHGLASDIVSYFCDDVDWDELAQEWWDEVHGEEEEE